MADRTGKRILLIRLSAIGDVVITTPVSRALREAQPDAFIAWVVEPRAADILKGNPYLDQVLVWERNKGALTPRDMFQLRRMLQPYRFDYAVDFQGLMRSALVARLSGARTIIGNSEAKEHADLLYHTRIPRRTDDLSSRQRCLDLLRPLGVTSDDRRMVFPIPDVERSEARGLLADVGVAPGQQYACLVPATTWKQKHWFEERWAELGELLRIRLGMTPVLLGARGDLPLASRILEAGRGSTVSLVGRTDLKTAGAVLAGAAVSVAVDTALMHASVAVGTPTVGVCGASGWPGFQDYEDFTLVREALSCSPCHHNPSCDGRFDCMRALSAERVFDAAEGLVRARPTFPAGLVVV